MPHVVVNDRLIWKLFFVDKAICDHLRFCLNWNRPLVCVVSTGSLLRPWLPALQENDAFARQPRWRGKKTQSLYEDVTTYECLTLQYLLVISCAYIKSSFPLPRLDHAPSRPTPTPPCTLAGLWLWWPSTALLTTRVVATTTGSPLTVCQPYTFTKRSMMTGTCAILQQTQFETVWNKNIFSCNRI